MFDLRWVLPNKHNQVLKCFKDSLLCDFFDVKSIVYNPDAGVGVQLIQLHYNAMLSLNQDFLFL